MRITVTFDDELGAEIETAAEILGAKKADWVKMACMEYLNAKTGSESSDKDKKISALNIEILDLKEKVETQRELREAYFKLISEKDQRIEDMKESISRIEAMSITTTDQIASSKDERIKDLTKMIEHLQGQAAAHSAALQSALKPSLESGNRKNNSREDDIDIVQKPKWKFWK